MNPWSYLILRVSVGISMLGHGLVRIPKLSGFSAWMVKSFEKSMLPPELIVPFSYALPFAELLTGVSLVLGLWTRLGLLLGSATMGCLLLGTSLIENWEAIPSQLIHAAFFAGLLHFIASNTFSIDQRIRN